MKWIVLLSIVAPLLVGCSVAAGQLAEEEPEALTPGEPVQVVTSAGDPSEPLPFMWATHRSHRPDGHRLLVQGGTIHAIASSVRLVDPSGQTISTAPTTPVRAPDPCLGDVGLLRADVPLAEETLAVFEAQDDWPAGYKLVALVGGTWRSTAPTFAGCRSIE